MFTYQAQSRVFEIQHGITFEFSNNASIEFELLPACGFGMENIPSRTAVKAHAGELNIDQETGRWTFQSNPPLEPLLASFSIENCDVKLVGNKVTHKFHCHTIEDLTSVLAAIKWAFPIILNLWFNDPPYVGPIVGTLGNAKFFWRMKREELKVSINTCTKKSLEIAFVRAIEYLQLFSAGNNLRLLAALKYFQTAVRLSVAGYSPWEFMAETVLNYAKCLEILFAVSNSSKDDVRRALPMLGYDKQEIEGDFIPIMTLRSWLDVAHPRLKTDKIGDRNILYSYLAKSENNFRKLLIRTIEHVKIDPDFLPPQPELELDKRGRKDMERLVEQMKTRLHPDVP